MQEVNNSVKAGSLLIAAPFLEDVNFSRSVILICEHTAQGTIGLIINQPTQHFLKDAIESYDGNETPLFKGGPVGLETLHTLHNKPTNSEHAKLNNGIFWGGQIDDLLQTCIDDSDAKCKLIVGYSGWSSNQLQNEINEGSWFVAESNEEIVFQTDTKDVWKKAVELLGPTYKIIANMPLHPQMN